jgi:hypothetical protein
LKTARERLKDLPIMHSTTAAWQCSLEIGEELDRTSKSAADDSKADQTKIKQNNDPIKLLHCLFDGNQYAETPETRYSDSNIVM